MTTKKPKKRNPQDATRANVQAANKKIAALKLKLKEQSRNKAETMKWIKSVEQRFKHLEARTARQSMRLHDLEKEILKYHFETAMEATKITPVRVVINKPKKQKGRRS